ncbi:MAG TPA: tautomerase family protein [Candidatus Dormibacteraeota bacterium]|jgi:4-oxalocrotonate tautomerase|nr:tautomerase family protein [Candidatus Dormibacteraeota bacterium]
MPNITVELLKGRTIDQRRRFVQAVTDNAVEILNAKREAVRILLVEIDRADVANGGVFVADEPPKVG